MPLRAEASRSAVPDAALHRVAALLGGQRVLRHSVASPIDAHDLLLRGLPGQALTHLVDSFRVLHKTASLEKAVGISPRTFQRRKDTPAKKLTPDQSGRTWKFAEILVWASDVLGGQTEAERWLERPATGLDGQRPIDLLATPAGVRLVEAHLTRLEFGVYT